MQSSSEQEEPSQKKTKTCIFGQSWREMDLVTLTAKLSDFVYDISEREDRRYFWIHANEVSSISLTICAEGNRCMNEEQKKIIMIVAWLHGIANFDGSSNVFFESAQFLRNITSHIEEYRQLLKTIKRTSLDKQIKRKEKKKEILKFCEFSAFGYSGQCAVEIVGDACRIQSFKEILKNIPDDGPPRDSYMKLIKKLTTEKLLRIKDEFLVTGMAKEMIKPLHDKLILALIIG